MDQLQSADSHADPSTATEGSRVVEELLRAFSTALRSFKLYGGDSPMLERFVTALQERFLDVWKTESEVRIYVEEHRFLYDDRVVYPSGGEPGELPFLFYKDGIRELTFLPGAENEALALLSVVARGSQVRDEEDDLVTLLWQQEFEFVQYKYVELVSEGVSLGGGTGSPPAQIDAEAVRSSAAAPPAPEEKGLTADDFQETLYFLDEAELRTLSDELRKEAERDLFADVVSGLFDRLEDGDEERRLRIIHILGELLPSMLGAGRLDRAASMLEELADLAGRPNLLSPKILREIRTLFGALADPDTIQQLILTLEDSPGALEGGALGTLLGFFPPESLAPLLRSVEHVTRPEVRRVLEQAVERLAKEHRDTVVEMLKESDERLVTEAVAWVKRLQIGSATPELIRLLGHPSTAVRLAVIDALQGLRAATAGKALVPLLKDGDREIRVAVARALGALEFGAARGPLEGVVTSKHIRSADRTEKIACFEAYGRLAGQEGVAILDKILNGKSWLGRADSSEIRACAALALARVRHPSARDSLQTASSDDDPVVRTAVARALRGESS